MSKVLTVTRSTFSHVSCIKHWSSKHSMLRMLQYIRHYLYHSEHGSVNDVNHVGLQITQFLFTAFGGYIECLTSLRIL